MLPQYKITDSTRYGGNENELTYNVVTQDSVIALSCYVTKYPTEFGYAGFDINRAMKSQKSELIYGIKSPILLSQQITEIDSVKVGYVKYLIETENDKYYEARIFFFRDRRFVNIYITENYSNNTDSASASVSDCIFKSVALNH